MYDLFTNENDKSNPTVVKKQERDRFYENKSTTLGILEHRLCSLSRYDTTT